MPRVNYCSTQAVEMDALAAVLREACYREAGSTSAAAYIVDLSPSTWRRKVDDPGSIQLEDLIRAAKRLKIKKGQLMPIIERLIY